MRARMIESSALFALAFFVTVLLHESAHAVAGLLRGRGPILFTGHVDYAVDGSVADQIATAATGPVFSLLSGLALFAWVRAGLHSAPRARLFVAWLAFHGVVNFVGYLFSAWFAAGADVGRVVRLLGVPTAGQIALMALAFVLLRLLARPFGVVFAELAPEPLVDDSAARAWAKHIAVFAGLLAVPALVVSALPVPHWLALIYCMVSPLPLFDLPDALAKARASAARSPLPAPRPALFWAAFVVVVVVARVVLDGGVAFGAAVSATGR